MLETPKVLSTLNSENLNECNNGQSAGNQNNKVITFITSRIPQRLYVLHQTELSVC